MIACQFALALTSEAEQKGANKDCLGVGCTKHECAPGCSEDVSLPTSIGMWAVGVVDGRVLEEGESGGVPTLFQPVAQ